MTNRELMSKGVAFAEEENGADSALEYLSVLTSRYLDDMSTDDKRLCAQAYVYMWSVHFDRDCNFAVQYENLMSALQIAQNADLKMPELYLHIGNLYHTIADICVDSTARRVAIDHYKQAFWRMLEAGEAYRRFPDVAMTDMAICAHDLHDLKAIATEEQHYRSLSVAGDSAVRAYNLLLLDGYQALDSGRPMLAVDYFHRSASAMPMTYANFRYCVQADISLAEAYEALGNNPEAQKHLLSALEIAEHYNIKDLKVDLYGRLMRFFERRGERQLSTDYMKKHYGLKDSIVNRSQIAALNDAKINHEIQNAQNRNRQLQEANYRQRLLIFVSIVAVIIVGLFLVLLGIKNRQILHRNRVLYEKNQELISMDKLLQHHRQNSQLGEDSMAQLKNAILQVMNSSEEIFSSDFTIDHLARLVNSNQKYVSQTINTMFGCNFNVFLNKFRAKEACRRLSDVENVGRYTMDALANSLGFRSRTSFTTAFKAYTGQTPSEYLRVARQKHETARSQSSASYQL